MKGEIRTVKRASIARKGLSNITNSPMPFKILAEDSKPSQAAAITREYVDQLIKENKELMKLFEERNKIIELSGVELQRLRVSYQKTQLQNWNLAQSNSQMLVELNQGKEKLKALHHELACKNALLKAKNLELVRKAEENSVKTRSVEVEQEAVPKENDQSKTINRNRRHQRSQSLGGVPKLNKQEHTEKEKVENKRHCLRRQSARFVSQESEPSAEKLFEIEEAKFPLRKDLQTLMRESDPTFMDPSHKEDQGRDGRASIGGRPLRRASGKVQSYREPPLNVKMRRES